MQDVGALRDSPDIPDTKPASRSANVYQEPPGPRHTDEGEHS